MFVIGSNRKKFENQGVNCICLHMSAVREMVAPIYKHLFVLTYSHFCFNVGLPPSLSLTEQQYPVCYWSNIMIKGAVCRTKNRPAIQLCYSSSLSFLQDDLGKSTYLIKEQRARHCLPVYMTKASYQSLHFCP